MYKKSYWFVTDRETGLVNVIEKNFPNCDVIMCWNHLINDLRFNLQKMGAYHSNIAVYVTNIKELLRCNSEDEYTEKKTILNKKSYWHNWTVLKYDVTEH
jgi:hypothetical protein